MQIPDRPETEEILYTARHNQVVAWALSNVISKVQNTRNKMGRRKLLNSENPLATAQNVAFDEGYCAFARELFELFGLDLDENANR